MRLPVAHSPFAVCRSPPWCSPNSHLWSSLTAIGLQAQKKCTCPCCLSPPPGQPRTAAIFCCSLCCISITSWTTLSVLLAHASKAAACRQCWQLSVHSYFIAAPCQAEHAGGHQQPQKGCCLERTTLKGECQQAEYTCQNSYWSLKRAEEQPPLRAADEPAAPGGAALAPAAVGGAPPASNRAARVGKFHARGSLCPLLQYFIPKTV